MTTAPDISLTSNYSSFRLVYYIRELIDVIDEAEPTQRTDLLTQIGSDLQSFESDLKVIVIVKLLLATLLALDCKARTYLVQQKKEVCLAKLKSRAENWMDLLSVYQPPQLYDVLANMSDEIEDIKSEAASAPPHEKSLFQTLNVLANRVNVFLLSRLQRED